VGVKELILTVHAGWANGGRARGSSAIEDWADSIAYLTFKDTSKDKEKGPQFLQAIGRDVSVDEDQLVYDPKTRLLTMARTASRTDLNRLVKVAALIDPVCRYVTDHPGASRSAIVKAIRVQRKAGDVKMGFQDADIDAAIVEAEKDGKLRRQKCGEGKLTKHFPATISQPTTSGQGES
jgi:hypothetical protein